MTKKIQISDAARVVLTQMLKIDSARPRDGAELRGQNVTFRELGLEEIEAIGSTEGGEARLAAMKATDVTEREVTETTAIYLNRQFDRLLEIFPGGEMEVEENGQKRKITVPAGMPTPWSRLLGPLLEELDREFPPAETKAA